MKKKTQPNMSLLALSTFRNKNYLLLYSFIFYSILEVLTTVTAFQLSKAQHGYFWVPGPPRDLG